MNTRIAFASLLALAAAGAADAAPRLAKNADCFWPNQVQRFAPDRDRAVNVRLDNGAVYHFELYGGCPDIDWRQQIGLVADSPGRICRGRETRIETQTSLGPLRCAVRSMRRMSEAEVRGLPDRARP